MYTVKGDGIVIYSDVSVAENQKAINPTLNLVDNAAGSLSITLPPGNDGYNTLNRLSSEIVVYNDGKELWSGRILSEDRDFNNNRILTCEGELAYLQDSIQPQKKFEEGTTVGIFLEYVLDEHNKKFTDERYKFYADKSYIYNYDEPLPEITIDYENTLSVINTNIVEYFECHLIIQKIDGKKYFKMIKEDSFLNENTQEIRFGTNLLDFTRNWDLTDMGTVIIPRGATVEKSSSEESENFDSFITLSDIPKDNVVEMDEIGEYLRDENGKLMHDDDGNLIYEYHEKTDGNGKPVYKYQKDENGYIALETVTVNSKTLPSIRVDTNQGGDTVIVEFIEYDSDGNATVTSKIETDGMYANVYLKNEDGDFYSLVDTYGRIEKVADFSDAEDSVQLLKKTRDYVKEHRFDQMTLEVSAIDLKYLSNDYESIKMLDRVRCISVPHAMDTLFTVKELSIPLDDRVEGATYTMQKSLENASSLSSLSKEISSVTSELESPHSKILKKAQSNADKLLRESVNGYVTLITDTKNGRHSEALVISSGRDYSKSEHFWIWNVNGLGHYTEYAGAAAPKLDSDDLTNNWDNYVLNLGITMDGAIVANRITVGHMSADRVRTGVLISQDGNVIWNLNKDDQNVTYSYTDSNGKEQSKTVSCPGGSMMIKKGSITLGANEEFSVNNDGYLKAESGTIGGFSITAYDIHNDSMTLDATGLALKNENVNVGHIGTSQWEAEPSKKVLVMNLEKDAAAIGWGVRENKSDDTFTAMFLYANKKYQGYYPGKFYMHGDLDMRGYLIENFSLDPDNMVVNNGANADCLLLRPGAINTDGTINPAYAKQVRIQNGFIVSG